jgi:hypothetical protein
LEILDCVARIPLRTADPSHMIEQRSFANKLSGGNT